MMSCCQQGNGLIFILQRIRTIPKSVLNNIMEHIVVHFIITYARRSQVENVKIYATKNVPKLVRREDLFVLSMETVTINYGTRSCAYLVYEINNKY